MPIEVEETFTVRQTKEKIEEEHKLDADSLKLIKSGKVLGDDAKSLMDHDIKDGCILVVMMNPKKKQP